MMGPSVLAAAFCGCGGLGLEEGPAPATGGKLESRGASAPVSRGESDAPPKLVQARVVLASTGEQRKTAKVAKDKNQEPEKIELKRKHDGSGPDPGDFYWQPSDPSKIHDEPLTVKTPQGLPPLIANVNVPAANPLTKGKVELGKMLYFDARISKDTTVSCATCHNPAKGWTDRMTTSIGIDGQRGGRNAPTVLNTVYGRLMFWDGRAPSLEGQSQGPPRNPIEMGDQSFEEIVDRLRKISAYQDMFAKVFGTEVTLDGIAKAIAAFERATALSGGSKYDKYVAGDYQALSDSEKRGMILFGLRLDQDDEYKTDVVLKKADCTSCHAGFNFTDEQFHNLGVGWDPVKKAFADPGRWAATPIGAKNPAEMGAFKTPTVRDAAQTGPYMHDGSLKTLEEVVEHYNKGGIANPSLDKDIRKLGLTDKEKADVVAFMKALSGVTIKVELPKLPAGPRDAAPDPADALMAPGSKAALNHPHGPLQF